MRGRLLGCFVVLLVGCGSAKTVTVTKTVTNANTTGADTSAATADTMTTTASSGPPDCDAAGINSTGLKEGLCRDGSNGLVRVVNRSHTLRMKEMTVHYNGYRTATTLSSDVGRNTARGVFVIVNLRVNNRTDSGFDYSDDMFDLEVGDKHYSPTFDVENGTDQQSLEWQTSDNGFPPDQPISGDVVFDVPRSKVVEMEKTGNVMVADPSDAENGTNGVVGIIRTYD